MLSFRVVQARFLTDLVALSIKETKRRVLALATMFSIVAIIALAVVIQMPQTWEASAILIAEGNNIIKPLMEGRAVPTTITDQTALVTQVMQSRRILREVLAFGGWLNDKPTAREEERMLERLKARIKIDGAKGELIRIAYRDTDPERTYIIANKLAEIYVREGTEGKERESREAFDFISKQVTEYGEKLNDAHSKLLAQYRGEKPIAADPAHLDAPRDPAPAHARSSISKEELAAMRAEEATLASQLGRKRANGADESRLNDDQVRARVTQLQVDLDRLLATYTDEHPDVKRAKRDLAAAKEDLHRLEKVRADREGANAVASALDDEVSNAARARLEQLRRQIAAATGIPMRPHSSGTARPIVTSDAQTVVEMRGVGQDTQLSELLRRYEATRDVYQDLLKRRENARVSMDLDLERRGLTLRVQEAAELPVTASGLRLMHQVMIALVLALLVPLAYLFVIIRLDPRVRTVAQLDRHVPVLAMIPYGAPPSQDFRDRNHFVFAIAMVVSVAAVYAIVFMARLKH